MARLTDQPEPVVVLVGYVLPTELGDNPGFVQVLVGGDRVVDAPSELAGFLDFIRTPRLETDASDWIVSAGGSRSDLEDLVAAGRLRRVVGGSSLERLESLSGLRLVPLGFPVRASEPDGSVVWIGASPEATALLPVNALAAGVMWEQQGSEDFPATVDRLRLSTGLSPEEVARRAISDVDGLLANRLARLEPLEE